MSAAINFTVPGLARGKGRPRIGRVGAHARMFTDAKTASYENLVALAAREAMGAMAPMEGALSLSMRVRIVPAQSASRKAREAMLAGEIMPTKKPDLDNVAKAVMDGLNRVAFADDALIVQHMAIKVYAETAGVDVAISRYRRAA